MGELHIEILRDRIALEYGIEPVLGRMRVSYRESLTTRVEDSLCLDREYHGKRHFAEVKMVIEGMEEADGMGEVKSDVDSQNEVRFDF